MKKTNKKHAQLRAGDQSLHAHADLLGLPAVIHADPYYDVNLIRAAKRVKVLNEVYTDYMKSFMDINMAFANALEGSHKDRLLDKVDKEINLFNVHMAKTRELFDSYVPGS